MFNSSCWWINIVFTKNGIHTLAKVVINPTCVDLFSQSCTIQRFVAFDVVQTKRWVIVVDTPMINTPMINSSFFNNWDIWISTQIGWRAFTRLCQHHLELQMAKRPYPFCLGYFFTSKNFNYIEKEANIFHLKSGCNNRPSYFPTFTFSRRSPHCHDWPITSDGMLRWRFFDISLC
jgi:hypothetical protein